MTADLSIESMEKGRLKNDIFKVLKGNNCHPSILSSLRTVQKWAWNKDDFRQREHSIHHQRFLLPTELL